MKTIAVLVFLLVCFSSQAQVQPTDLDKSPMDMNYSPQGYPILKMNGKITTPPNCRIVYSRPQKTGREIFGGIINYGQIWRIGANEATEIEFFRNVKIDGKIIAKGRYTMYAICKDDNWTIILNKEKDVWGLYYNTTKDVIRTDVPVTNTEKMTEAFTMYFEDVNGGTNLVIMWDTVKVIVPIKF
ncbi:MAG: DUF2911 domain-containing protein [Panacibacter sp.]